MIIFDLDGTLADCEHRRHFVDPEKNDEYSHRCNPRGQENLQELSGWYHLDTNKKWKSDWKAFYEACDKDKVISKTLCVFQSLQEKGFEIQIWSGRCESVRNKTYFWFDDVYIDISKIKLRMRPIGDSTPDDELKEKWLDQLISEDKTIDFVFDDRPKVVRMWRRRGIFVFDVNQSGK